MPALTLTPSFERAPLPARLLSAANRHTPALAWLACTLAVLPVAALAWDAYTGQLGSNPLERVLRTPGRWALILLLVVLSATPLRHAFAFSARQVGMRYGRRPADWNWMIQLRRPLGLAGFFYSLTHAALYLSLDVGFNWPELATDLQSKPYILAGLAAFLLLVPLALTSSDASMRRFKRNWKRLHTLVYPAAILAVLHFFWLTKPGVSDPYIYALVLAVLLGYRVAAKCLRVRETAPLMSGELTQEIAPRFTPERRMPEDISITTIVSAPHHIPGKE